MRLIQHKREAYWFYRFLSMGYDRWVNPLFWTPPMRSEALDLARLDSPTLRVVDVGAGTGFATEEIVERVSAANVTMLDQSPHQLQRARSKAALSAVDKRLGDAEALPFEDDAFDRYVSTGSIEYWPDPQRAICEAYRVVRPGGWAMIAGPVPPDQPVARALADVWMLFPPESDYRRWFVDAGFADVVVRRIAPSWSRSQYAIAIAGRVPAAGPSPLAASLGAPVPPGRMNPLRFILGSAAGAAFVPIGAAMTLRQRLMAARSR